MWTAEILSSNLDSSNLSYNIVVRFTDGIKVNDIPFKVSDPSSINRICQNQINQYTAIANTVPQLGLVDLTPIVPTPPQLTQDELDKIAYTTDYQKSLKYQAGIKQGIIDANDATYVALQKSLKDNFKPDYLSVLTSGPGLL